MTYPTLKMFLDVVGSVILLLIGLPLFIVIICVAMVAHGRPIFFTQVRTGLQGKPFTLLKFRSMSNIPGETDSQMALVTRFGKFLRRFSLDEAPQLVNILKGDMSFVGPRPLLLDYLPLYSESQLRRHDVRPGLTGLAQVNGRNHLSWTEKFAWDLKYVESVSFSLDLKIILQTLFVALRGQGVQEEGSDSVTPFRGER